MSNCSRRGSMQRLGRLMKVPGSRQPPAVGFSGKRKVTRMPVSRLLGEHNVTLRLRTPGVAILMHRCCYISWAADRISKVTRMLHLDVRSAVSVPS